MKFVNLFWLVEFQGMQEVTGICKLNKWEVRPQSWYPVLKKASGPDVESCLKTRLHAWTE